MVRGLWGTVIAAALCAVAAILVQAVLPQGTPAGPLLLVAAGLTLFLAVAAMALAWRGGSRAAAMEADIAAMARALDAATRAAVERDERRTGELAALGERLDREIDRLERAMPARDTFDPGSAAPGGGNVLRHPGPQRTGRTAIQDPGKTRPADEAPVAQALARLTQAGPIELALQPIVSVSEGATRGFETCLHLDLHDGSEADIRRVHQGLPGLDTVALEQRIVEAALEAARQRLGDTAGAMPLHVAVSETLLASKRFAAILETVRNHPPLAPAIVLSLPVSAPQAGSTEMSPALARSGIRLAAEDWTPASAADAAKLAAAGVAFAKIAADRLLDRMRRRSGLAGSSLLEILSAAGIVPIATDVRTDEDALALVDLGVDLMTGPRFSGPRRLRPDRPGDRPGRQAPAG